MRAYVFFGTTYIYVYIDIPLDKNPNSIKKIFERLEIIKEKNKNNLLLSASLKTNYSNAVATYQNITYLIKYSDKWEFLEFFLN
jgi:hypothetical protein